MASRRALFERTLRSAAVTAGLLLLLAVLAIACSRAPEAVPAAEDAAQVSVEASARKGPVDVTARLDRGTLSIADFAELRIDVEADADVTILLPEPEEIPIEPFTIRDFDTEKPRLVDDGRQVSAITARLEPFLSGEYEVGPVSIGFTIEGELDDEGNPKEFSVEVGPLALAVTSLTGEASEALDIRPLKAQAELPEAPAEPLPWWIFAAIAAGLIAAVVAIVFLARRSKHREVAVRVRTPREIALEALASLEAKELLVRGEIKQFYFEICLILREFIEGQFGLRAAEETTEEFLRDLAAEPRFSEETKELLRQFLEHCDQVKFAKYAPAADEIQKTVTVTRSFVESSTVPDPAETAAVGTPAGEEASRGV